MNFENKLISGVLIKRYKRFFVDVLIKNKKITAHCPNTGSMLGLVDKGLKVWLTKSNNPKRKLQYTLQVVEKNGSKVGVNTHLTNKIFSHGVKSNYIKEFHKNDEIQSEVKFGLNTRFDFLIKNKKTKTFVEVKNVTLSRSSGIAEFPDAITARGAKHITELLSASKKGFKIVIAFIVQREDCKKFKIAKDIDVNYSLLLTDAIKKNLQIICYDCKFSTKGIKINKKLELINE